MIYTADYLIEKRKAKWSENQSIDYDKKLRAAIANELLENKELLAEVKRNPEKLIELVFGICPSCLMDKERKTLREASLLLGLTESGAEQKLKRILKKLRNAMQN